MTYWTPNIAIKQLSEKSQNNRDIFLLILRLGKGILEFENGMKDRLSSILILFNPNNPMC